MHVMRELAHAGGWALRPWLRCMRLGSACWLAVFMLACSAGALAEDEQALKEDAVKRLTDSNDPALSVYIGRVYVKQAALKAAREVLEQRGRAAGLGPPSWNLDTPQWQG